MRNEMGRQVVWHLKEEKVGRVYFCATQIAFAFFFFNISQAQQGHSEGISHAAILEKPWSGFVFKLVGRWPDQSGGGAAAATGSCS